MENSFIKKMTRRILHGRREAFFDRSIMHPQREWFIGILVGFLILGSGVFWSVNNLIKFKFDSVTANNDGVEEEKVIYREGLVEAALTDSATRKEAYEKLKAVLLNRYGQAVVTPSEPLDTEADTPLIVEDIEIISEPEPEPVNNVSDTEIIFE